MPIGPARMPLMDHLGELRMRCVRIVVVLLVAVVFFYFSTPTVAQLMLAPVKEFIPQTVDGKAMLNVFGSFEAFGVRLQIALWTSLVACAPFVMWQILAFFLPALKPSERKWFIPTFVIAVALFLFGAVFCYFIILPAAFEWLTDQANGFAVITPQATLWIDIIIKFELGFGFAFELPLIVFYLIVFEIVPYAKLREKWREIYVVLLVISGMITPDASPVTMLLMYAPLIGMYEISMAVARAVMGKRIQEQKEELEEQARQDAEWEEEWADFQARRAEQKAKRLAKKEAE
ncbi:MAG: twin-arginine translocase subunit TatC [Coriobacteriia bacterium]|nr:twin-arginine translocase subunit TatC [Coriobacteriia bacterium]